MNKCKQTFIKPQQYNIIKKLTFSKTQWKFHLTEKDKFFNNLEREKLREEQLVGIRKLISCLNWYLNIMENVPCNWDRNLIWIETYTYIKLITGEYVRATDDRYNLPWFSDIAIYMDESEHDQYLTDNGYCYGHVSLT